MERTEGHFMSFSSRSLPAPTDAESRRMAQAKAFGCIACYLAGLGQSYCGPVEYNHALIGGRRAGHRFGYALGQWHHQAYVLRGHTAPQMRTKFGPSLREGSKPFHAAYGSEQRLCDIQNALLGLAPERLARQRGPGSGKRSAKTGHRNGSSTATPSKIVPRGERIV